MSIVSMERVTHPKHGVESPPARMQQRAYGWQDGERADGRAGECSTSVRQAAGVHGRTSARMALTQVRVQSAGREAEGGDRARKRVRV